MTGAPASVLVVAGPTASGKSALGLALAVEFGGCVINADSMQVYSELEILTARPDADALAAAPHRLYGVLSGREACSAGRWRDLARKEIEAALAADRLPILVGGTGLYLRALEEGLAELPPIPPSIRLSARQRQAALGNPAFHEALAARDPVMAARLHPNDSQRLVRAWEVLEATGRSLAGWQAESRETAAADAAPYRFLRVTLLPERAALYTTCDRRFEAMVAAGALEEVRRLRDLGLDPGLPVMKALGVRPLLQHLAGEAELEAAIAAGQQETRRYAKRQLTWLRTQVAGGGATEEVVSRTKNASWSIAEQYSGHLDREIFPKIRDSLLTPLG